MKCVYIFFLGLLMFGCSRSSTSGTMSSWRTDSKPITSRIHAVDGSSAFTWKGELAGQSSSMSAPGPSTYRVRCFVEGFTNALPNAASLTDLQPASLPSDTVFPKHLHAASGNDWFISRTIDDALFSLKYQGKAFYSPSHDLLYFDVFWQ